MIFRPSGGLVYHWKAFRQRKRWREFSNEIAAWLDPWNPPVEKLILIGPSAGYTLPTEWLKRFPEVVAYDLDLLAPLFFRWNHPGVRVKFHRENVFWSEGRLSLAQLESIKARHPRSAFLFANVLGQVLLEGRADEAEWEEFLGGLRALMKGRHWASYHDLFTYEGGVVIDHLMEGAWNRGLKSQQFRWELTGDSVHTIQGVIDAP